MKHQLFVSLVATVFLFGCVAKPRGTYFQPYHPLGQSISQSCDQNSNKDRIEIFLTEGVLLHASLRKENEDIFVLSIGLDLKDGKSIQLASNSLSLLFSDQVSLVHSVEEWKSGLLIGGVVEQKLGGVTFTYDKSYGESININEPINETFRVVFPEFEISGVKRKLAPIEFKKMSGELQWLPKLNC